MEDHKIQYFFFYPLHNKYLLLLLESIFFYDIFPNFLCQLIVFLPFTSDSHHLRFIFFCMFTYKRKIHSIIIIDQSENYCDLKEKRTTLIYSYNEQSDVVRLVSYFGFLAETFLVESLGSFGTFLDIFFFFFNLSGFLNDILFTPFKFVINSHLSALYSLMLSNYIARFFYNLRSSLVNSITFLS